MQQQRRFESARHGGSYDRCVLLSIGLLSGFLLFGVGPRLLSPPLTTPSVTPAGMLAGNREPGAVAPANAAATGNVDAVVPAATLLRPARDVASAAAAPVAASAALPRVKLVREAWANALVAAHLAKQGHEDVSAGQRMCTFALFEPPGGVPPIWFAKEDTLHSAKYIMDLEGGNVKWWAERAARAVASPGGCFAADIGSNGGFFGLTARALGCTVIAADAQPRCLQRLESAAAVNGFSSGIMTVWTAAGVAGTPPITVGATRCSGLWAVAKSEWIDDESETKTTVQVRPLTDILASPVVSSSGGGAWLPNGASLHLLKIDAEGSEVAILRSALPLLRAGRILSILAEVTPYRVIEMISTYAEVVDTFTTMYEAGYRCGIVGDTSLFALPVLLSYFVKTSVGAWPDVSVNWACELTDRN